MTDSTIAALFSATKTSSGRSTWAHIGGAGPRLAVAFGTMTVVVVLIGGAIPGTSHAGPGSAATQANLAGFGPPRIPPAPPPPNYEIKLLVRAARGDGLRALLLRTGVSHGDAEAVDRLTKSTLPPGDGNELTILLGDRSASGRSLQGLTYRPRLDLVVEIIRDQTHQLRLATQSIAVDATPRRFSGMAGTHLYWSMRAAGVSPEIARQYFEALSDRLGRRWQAAPDDRFDLVVDHRLAATGEARAGPILYALLDRRRGPDVRLVRWTVAGREGFYEPDKVEQDSEGLHRPVAGAVSSSFGVRVHPLLRFARFHRGVDFRAQWGSPVRAAADGAVLSAGWHGGHGRRVRLAHADGLETSYSHMSQIATSSGKHVRKGQIIGYVGSSGFSTGPHLHYEAWRHGHAVDPLSLRHAGSVRIAPADLAAMSARLAQLQSI